MRDMGHFHNLNIFLSTKLLAPLMRRGGWVISASSDIGTFAYPIITNCFLPKCDAQSTPGLLKNLMSNLDTPFSYPEFKEAVSAYLHRTEFVVVSNKLTPLFWDQDIIIAYMLEMVLQGTVNVPIPSCHIE